MRRVVVRRAGDYYEVYENDDLVMKLRSDLDLTGILADAGFDVAIIDGKIIELVSLRRIIEDMKSPECGAVGVFVGYVKGISRGRKVLRLEYERYDELYERKRRELERILGERYGVNVRIYHKVGVFRPGDDVLYVVVVGRSRKDVFEPLRECVELVKRELPVWKKEVYENGEEVWVHDIPDDERGSLIMDDEDSPS